MTDFTSYETITIDGTDYPRPLDFAPQREDIYAGEYETCTGRKIVDRVGWRYSDMTMTWDSLPAAKAYKLSQMGCPASFTFDDSDSTTGPRRRTEQIVRTSSVNMLHPYRQQEGLAKVTYYRQVSVNISFIEAHT